MTRIFQDYFEVNHVIGCVFYYEDFLHFYG